MISNALSLILFTSLLLVYSGQITDGQPQCPFCIANPNASDTMIQQKLDYFCGANPASCALIQPGQPCYVANDLRTTASYVYDYWFVGGAECNFDDTGLQTYQDLSHGDCKFLPQNCTSA
ncbi:glucan endo-1,3-beta-glucosidase 4-like [Spinacia oleracea]|uniref:Glucan endo-1,3-beta-glucosidase 4-like n=1 Tax=Spinacia oleracea TaxID=3562 RepID=A0ABM3QTP8_SPIOL|nr:glucan endo-1,3-beta-glucosidase 4-like [Spinacia oleracea]